MEYMYIYKITCTQGIWKDHFYVGKHTTNNINDGYKGSGTKINEYYKLYPNDYIKEIVCFCNSNEELLNEERSIIKKYLRHPLCLNLVESNFGGKQSKESLQKAIETRKRNNCWHSKETKEKISNINKEAKWMNNGIERHYVLKDKINEYLENGYVFGFKMRLAN